VRGRPALAAQRGLNHSAGILNLVPRLSCRYCGSKVLQRSHARGLGERLLRAFTHMRPWRCDGCGRRQLSPLRPSRRALKAAGGEPAEAEPPAATPPKRKQRGEDPLEARIAAQRRKKQLWAAVLVVVTGVGLGLMVSRSPSAQGYAGRAP